MSKQIDTPTVRSGSARSRSVRSQSVRAGARGGVMPFERYRAFEPIHLPDRRWPDRQIEVAPRWCSVDLRDGNQALVEPMGSERKHRMFDALVEMGFCEIEVGFPSASQTDFDFVRELIDGDRIPAHVTIQVLTQSRRELIERTLESVAGARRPIVHLYNPTSTLQRRVVFELDRKSICEIAVQGTHWVNAYAEQYCGGDVRFEYSPESFTGTELDFALEVCEAVLDEWGATPQAPVILNLPATVEMATPNVYADQIEWFCDHLRERERAIVSVHPHNDRGCAVAAAELAVMAGAERVEGTLFGNGERTGNVDLVTLALNLVTQGVDPELALSDIGQLVATAEFCNRLPVHPRHPYAGELVFTAFSGSHQDAINKGMADQERRAAAGDTRWEVPYLPMDPADVGRTYAAIIRVNSQSGKGGVAYLLERDHGLSLPRWFQQEFSAVVQRTTDLSEEEISTDELWALFRAEYLSVETFVELLEHKTQSSLRGVELEASISSDAELVSIAGSGGGPIEAFVCALRDAEVADLQIRDFSEHAFGSGCDATAVAYVQVEDRDGHRYCGVGMHESIVSASLAAIVCAENRRRKGNGAGRVSTA